MARGHVRKRGDSSYQAIVYAGIDPVTKRQRYLRQTARTPKEAERALTRLLSQVDEQRTPNTSATVGYLLDRWLELLAHEEGLIWMGCVMAMLAGGRRPARRGHRAITVMRCRL
jgi:hypothetical protein